MSDRELLEMAAKAAGLRATGRYDFQSGLEVSALHSAPYDWNPLDNDGDALRLAGKLRIGLVFDEDCDSVIAGFDHGIKIMCACQLDDVGIRRSIVHAAAEIWRATP